MFKKLWKSFQSKTFIALLAGVLLGGSGLPIAGGEIIAEGICSVADCDE